MLCIGVGMMFYNLWGSSDDEYSILLLNGFDL